MIARLNSSIWIKELMNGHSKYLIFELGNSNIIECDHNDSHLLKFEDIYLINTRKIILSFFALDLHDQT